MLDLRALVAADLATVGHNDDLFEEGNRGDAHFHCAWVEAAGARRWESDQLLLDIALFVTLLIEWLGEVDAGSSDLSLAIRKFSLSVGLEFRVVGKRLHLLKKGILLLLGLFDSFGASSARLWHLNSLQ